MSASFDTLLGVAEESGVPVRGNPMLLLVLYSSALRGCGVAGRRMTVLDCNATGSVYTPAIFSTFLSPYACEQVWQAVLVRSPWAHACACLRGCSPRARHRRNVCWKPTAFRTWPASMKRSLTRFPWAPTGAPCSVFAKAIRGCLGRTTRPHDKRCQPRHSADADACNQLSMYTSLKPA